MLYLHIKEANTQLGLTKEVRTWKFSTPLVHELKKEGKKTFSKVKTRDYLLVDQMEDHALAASS